MLRKLIVGTIVANFVFILASVIGPIGELTKFTGIVVGNNTAQYDAVATVPEFLEITSFLYKMLANGTDVDFPAGPQTGGLAYGTLNDPDGDGVLTGATAYAALFYPVTSGRKYKITWVGSSLGGPGGAKIGEGPDNGPGAQDAYLVYPDYQWSDRLGNSTQGGPPGSAIVGPIAKVAQTSGQPVYTSDNAGLTRAIRAYLGVSQVPLGGNLINYQRGHNERNGVDPYPRYDQGTRWDVVTGDQPGGVYSGSVTFTLNLVRP